MALAIEILVPQFSSTILSIGSHGLGLVARYFAKICTFFSMLVSALGMRYHNFYCSFSCYLPLTSLVSGVYIAIVILDLGCPVIELALSKRPN
jgi:hypothetical protein